MKKISEHAAARSAGESEITKEKIGREQEQRKTTITGQALFEGLIMVGPRRAAMAVRKTDESIVVEELSQGRGMVFFERLPIVRGIIRLGWQLVMGTKGLLTSLRLSESSDQPESSGETVVIPEAEQNREGIEQESQEQLEKMAQEAREAADIDTYDDSIREGKLGQMMTKQINISEIISICAGLVFSLILFVLLPYLAVWFISSFFSIESRASIPVHLLLNVIEGLLRVILLFIYLAMTGRIKEIERLWMYNGAQHKVISCYEAKKPLTQENIKKFSHIHERSSTALLFLTAAAVILVFSVIGVFLPKFNWWSSLLIYAAIVPLIAGFMYEIFFLIGRFDHVLFFRILMKPGIWVQNFIAKEPESKMLDVAVSAFEAVLPELEGEDFW